MIFYLSGTGNTRWAAQRLSAITGERLVNIADVFDGDCQFTLGENERIGFCFPVHGWRPPRLVRQFIGKLHIGNAEGHYGYALCTAGDNIGETFDIFERDLANAGIWLSSRCSLLMPESYVGLPFMDVDQPAKEKAKKSTAAEQLEGYAQHVLERKQTDGPIVRGRWPRINSRLLGGYFINHLVTDKPFRVDDTRCIRCGQCATVCPVGNIEGGKDRLPEWRHTGQCLTCFACYHHCPRHAIAFGSRTKGKGQYYYKPNI